MKRYLIYTSILCLHIVSIVSMDIDNEQSPNSDDIERLDINSQETPETEYCLLIQTNDSKDPIKVPESLRKYFKDKIEIAETFNPETMIYKAAQITAFEAREAINVLKYLEIMGTQNLNTEILMPMSLDRLMGLARASAYLNLYVLKSNIYDVLIPKIKIQFRSLESQKEQMSFLETLNTIEDIYTTHLKNDPTLPFKNFTASIRDTQRTKPAFSTIITSVKLNKDQDYVLTDNGTHVLWIDNNQLQELDLNALTLSFFNPITAGFTPKINMDLTATPNGSHICLWQGTNRAILLNNTTQEFETILESYDPIIEVAISNDGQFIACAQKNTIVLTYITEETTRNVTIPSVLPSNNLKSCFFSKNGELLYLKYKNKNSYVLCIYNTKSAQLLLQFNWDNLHHVFAGKDANSFWTLTDAGLTQYYIVNVNNPEERTIKKRLFINIEVAPKDIEDILVNNDESFIILEKNNSSIELINVLARRTECIYWSFQKAVFDVEGKHLIAIEDQPHEDGTYNILKLTLLSPTVTTEINQLFDSLTLAQIIRLEGLMNMSNKEELAQQLKEFLKTIPYNLQQLIHIYIFPDLSHQRPQSENDEPPAKKQKKS